LFVAKDLFWWVFENTWQRDVVVCGEGFVLVGLWEHVAARCSVLWWRICSGGSLRTRGSAMLTTNRRYFVVWHKTSYISCRLSSIHIMKRRSSRSSPIIIASESWCMLFSVCLSFCLCVCLSVLTLSLLVPVLHGAIQKLNKKTLKSLSHTWLFSVSRTRTVLASRAFRHSVVSVWNDLPAYICNVSTIRLALLKTTSRHFIHCCLRQLA